MRITIYETGGNSLNPFIKLFVFLIVLGLFVMPVSAFEDNFNDQNILDWSIDSGSWATSNISSIDGGDDYYASNYIFSSAGTSTSTTNEMHKYVYTKYSYYEIDMKAVSTKAGTEPSYSTFVFESNGNDERSISLKHVTDVSPTHHYFEITGSGFGYSNTILFDTGSLVVTTEWYHIEIFTTNENIQVDIYDDTDTLLNTQTCPYTSIEDKDRIILRNFVNDNHASTEADNKACFDNIIMLSVSPVTANGIEWDEEQYIEGETASYSWNLQNSFWQDVIYKYRIQVLKDGSEIDTVKVSQTGTRYQDVDDAGTYGVKLQYSGLIFTNWQSIDSDSVNVISEVDSYINVPSTSAIKTNFTTTYLYGSTPISPIINIKVLQNDYTYKVIDTKILPSATAGTTYTTNLSISSLSPIGYYVVELYDNGQGKSFATDTIKTTYAYIPPSDVIGSSYINTTDSIYSLGSIISGSYAIDDTNYTDYYTKLQVYNIDKDIISFSFIPLHQVDNFDISITNSELDFYSDGVNRYSISTNFLTGQNAVRLASYNTDGSLNEVITQKNITLSIINNEGYGLTLSKYIVDETEIFAIKAITPVQASIVIHPLTLMGISDTTILINGSTQMSYAISIADTYTISLVSGGETKITQIIKVFEGEEIIAPIDEDEIIPDTTFQDNTTNLLNSPYLIGLFIMCVFLAIGATNGIGGTIVTGSIGLGIVCYMGIFPWILLVIEVLVVAVLMSKGIINLSGD